MEEHKTKMDVERECKMQDLRKKDPSKFEEEMARLAIEDFDLYWTCLGNLSSFEERSKIIRESAKRVAEWIKEKVEENEKSDCYESTKEFRARILHLIKNKNWLEFRVGMVEVAKRDWKGYKECLVDLMVETDPYPYTPQYARFISDLDLIFTREESKKHIQNLEDNLDTLIEEACKRKRSKELVYTIFKRDHYHGSTEDFRVCIPDLIESKHWSKLRASMLNIAQKDWEGYKECLKDLRRNGYAILYTRCKSDLSLIFTEEEQARRLEDLKRS